jgi:hypothetical protein
VSCLDGVAVVLLMVFAPSTARCRRDEKRDRIVMSDEYDNPPTRERSISEAG